VTSLALFALNATADLGRAIAQQLWIALAPHEEREFEDGEHKARPLDSVEGADAYVVQSLHSGPSQSAADKLVRLLFFIGALKDAGAARVTAVTPYLCYARKDRRTKARDPVTTRYLATLFESVGADTIITLDVHNPAAFENAFRGRTITATAARRGASRSARDSPKSTAAPAWSPATCSSAMSPARLRSSSTI
jgi:ribose-phosphate pyrophosphokinase